MGARSRKFLVVGIAAWCVLAHAVLWGAGRSPAADYPYRLVFAQKNLSTDANVTEITNLVRRCSALGFNGIVLSGSFDRIDLAGDDVLNRLKQVKAVCDENRMELIPLVFSAGYANGTLAHDPNLAAAVPVRGARFVVKGAGGVLEADSTIGFANGGFEEHRGDGMKGFGQDGPGKVSFVDTVERREGVSSLRFENVANARGGKARVWQSVAVRPFSCYEITFWVKTENLNPAERFSIMVQAPDDRVLMTWRPSLGATTDWQRVTLGFNSLTYDNASVFIGVWNGPQGRFWIDGLRMSEVGLLDIVRRPGTPIKVTSVQTGAVYREGEDFERIEDRQLSYGFDHEGPDLAVIPGGAIREGERLLVDYYQALELKETPGQMGVCLSEPKVYEIWTQVIRVLHDTIAPRSYFFSMDEIRHGGWCEACVRRNMTAAQLLGDCIARQEKIVRDIDPSAEVFIWSDMLDPNQNATDNYYLVNGDLGGSWQYIPKDLIIACWTYETRDKSLKHFDRLGFKTIACGYYDNDSPAAVTDWLASLGRTPGARGIMYTTWQDRYGFLGTFAGLLPKVRGSAADSK